MAAEINNFFERMRDEVLTGVHALVEGQAEAPKVKAVEEEPETINATTEVNYQLLKLIQYLHQQVAILVTSNNRTNTPNPTNTHNPSNASNTWNCRRRNTRKYCWPHGACSHTSIDFNMKNTGHKDAATFCDKMEGNENYCRTTAEWQGGVEIEKYEYSVWIQIPFNIKNIQ